ncbi:hypothetical protein [Streptomyces sp. NPDC090022]|uniref:hypothetical protein n=1 Tax=Streptomyces sp. NPDC090022 TaxID=3365920 RepID=UPI00380A00E4
MPDNAGPNVLYVRTVDKAGNPSQPAAHPFYVRPRAGMDKPGDATGDGIPDIWAVSGNGNGSQYLTRGGTSSVGQAAGSDEDDRWNTFKAIG